MCDIVCMCCSPVLVKARHVVGRVVHTKGPPGIHIMKLFSQSEQFSVHMSVIVCMCCSPVSVKGRDVVGRVVHPKGPSQLLLPAGLGTSSVAAQGEGLLTLLHHLMTHLPLAGALHCHLYQWLGMPATQ